MARRVYLGLAGSVIALALLMPPPAAAVNCKVVLKNLSVGRTPEQISETMMIDLSDVKRCQEEDAAKKAAEKPAAGEEHKSD